MYFAPNKVLLQYRQIVLYFTHFVIVRNLYLKNLLNAEGYISAPTNLLPPYYTPNFFAFTYGTVLHIILKAKSKGALLDAFHHFIIEVFLLAAVRRTSPDAASWFQRFWRSQYSARTCACCCKISFQKIAEPPHCH